MHRLKSVFPSVLVASIVAASGFYSQPARADRDTIFTRAGCHRKVKVKGKLDDCLRCIDDGGKFNYHPGRLHGVCDRGGTPPVPPPERREPERGDGDTIVTRAGCHLKVKVKGKRDDCLRCVDDGGKFHYNPGRLHGVCDRGGPPVDRREPERGDGDTIVTRAGCHIKVKVKGKREDCLRCIDDGGRFHYNPGRLHGVCNRR